MDGVLDEGGGHLVAVEVAPDGLGRPVERDPDIGLLEAHRIIHQLYAQPYTFY